MQPSLLSISFKFGTLANKAHSNLEMFKLNLRELWMIISLKMVQNLSRSYSINR